MRYEEEQGGYTHPAKPLWVCLPVAAVPNHTFIINYGI